MEFYKIVFADGKFLLQEDEEQPAAELTQEQLYLLIDRLGVMYHAKNLVLTLRKYIMLYYTNDAKEYVSLDDIPSLVVSRPRLSRKFNPGVEIESIAITFLDGDEENRVMLSPGGDIEARGVNIIEVWEMLDKLIDSLNEEEITETELLQENYDGDLSALRQKMLQYGKNNPETNQSEITWYWGKLDGVWQSIDLTKDNREITEAIFEVPHKIGHLRVWADKNGTIALRQQSYAWQEKIAAEAGQKVWAEIFA